MRRVTAIWVDNCGQDLVEYALLASLLFLGATTAVQGFANAANGMWQLVTNTIVRYL